MTMPSPHPNWVINKVAQPLPQIHPWAKAKKGRRKEERTCMFLHLRLRACAPPVALAERGGFTNYPTWDLPPVNCHGFLESTAAA